MFIFCSCFLSHHHKCVYRGLSKLIVPPCDCNFLKQTFNWDSSLLPQGTVQIQLLIPRVVIPGKVLKLRKYSKVFISWKTNRGCWNVVQLNSWKPLHSRSWRWKQWNVSGELNDRSRNFRRSFIWLLQIKYLCCTFFGLSSREDKLVMV